MYNQISSLKMFQKKIIAQKVTLFYQVWPVYCGGRSKKETDDEKEKWRKKRKKTSTMTNVCGKKKKEEKVWLSFFPSFFFLWGRLWTKMDRVMNDVRGVKGEHTQQNVVISNETRKKGPKYSTNDGGGAGWGRWGEVDYRASETVSWVNDHASVREHTHTYVHGVYRYTYIIQRY